MIQGAFFAIYYNAETLKRTETIENLLRFSEYLDFTGFEPC